MSDMTRTEAIERINNLLYLYYRDRHLVDGSLPMAIDETDIMALEMSLNSLKIDEQYDLAMETPERLFTKKEIDDAIERIEIAICEEEENTLIALGMANALTILNQKLGIGDKE